MKIEEIAQMEFATAEEIAPEAVKPGEWYIWKSSGLGYHSTTPFMCTGGSLEYGHKALLCDRRAKKLYPRTLGIPTPQRMAGYQRDYPSVKSQVFRAKQQPQLSAFEWQQLIGGMTVGLSRPTTGTDPELFIENEKGEVIPAYTFLPAKKATPNLYYDGFQAEFMAVPGSCQDGVGLSIKQRLANLTRALPKGAKFSAKSVVEVPIETLMSATQDQVEFGCRPSLNAYGLCGKPIAEPRTFPLRFAGGHMHWGIPKDTLANPDFPALAQDAIKLVDLVAGLISVSISEGLDDPRRRRYYGLAGEYRLPVHGIEYRTPSNSWLASPSVYHLLFTLGRAALTAGLQGWRERVMAVPEIAVVNAINNSDVELARGLIRAQKELFISLIESHWPKHSRVTFALIQQPMTAWGIHPKDMAINWRTLNWSNSEENPNCYPQRWGNFLELQHAQTPASNANAS